MMTCFNFESGGKRKSVNKEDVAFMFPSIVEEGEVFITLKTGKQFRAKHVEEFDFDSGYKLIAARTLNL